MSEPSPHPEHRTMKFTDARAHLSEVVNEVHAGRSRVVIEKNGIPAAVLVSLADLAQLQERDRRRAEAIAAMLRISKTFEGVSEDEWEREISKAIAETRAERAVAVES